MGKDIKRKSPFEELYQKIVEMDDHRKKSGLLKHGRKDNKKMKGKEHDKPPELSFRSYDYTPIEYLRTGKPSLKIYKACGLIEHIDPPQFSGFRNSKGSFSSRATISEGNSTITTTDISQKQYHKLAALQRLRKPIEVLGNIERDEAKNKTFQNFLKIQKFRAADRPLRILQASKRELKIVNLFLRRVSKRLSDDPRMLLHAIEELVIERLRIVGTAYDQRYKDSLAAIICQAVSGGNAHNASGKLHTCIIGHPASGKKLLAHAALLLNCVGHEADAMRTKLAGLTGAIVKRKETWEVDPGLLSTSNHGVLVIQDFDKCKIRSDILPILGKVMEDGKCIVAGAAKAIFDAETSIHIDINRRSDLMLDSKQRRNVVDDTTLPTYILSRFDFICELDKNPKRQSHKAYELLLGKTNQAGRSEIARFCDKRDLDPERFMKLLAGSILERFRRIDTSPIRKYMARKFKEIEKANRSDMESLDDLSMFIMRLSKSVEKLVNALTRLQLRHKANRKAVDMAYQLLARKLEFLKEFNEDFSVPQYKVEGKAAFCRWLVARCGDKGFSPEKIIKKYEDEGFPCGKRKPRALRNWINSISSKESHGVWRIKEKHLKRYSKD